MKVNGPISKKRKLGPKTVDCVFLGYAFHNIVYRFLVVKSEVPDIHVGMMGGGDIDCMSWPKPSSHKEQRDNSIRGMGEEKVKTL